MNENRRKQIYNNLISKDTEELLEIWQSGDVGKWEEEVFGILEEILSERLGYIPPQTIESQVFSILDRVEQYLEKNEFDKALSECEVAIQMYPDYAISYYYLGDIYDEMGQFENAIVNYQKAVQLDPEIEDALENLLIVEGEMIEEFEASNTKKHLDQALEYAYADEFEKALDECELAKSNMPSIAFAHNYLGLILQISDQLEPAIDSYFKATQLNPRFSAAFENLANARVIWEEEQYHSFSAMSPVEMDETTGELDESQIPDSDEPIPQWLYMDKSVFFLAGWPGHRTRQGRSGFDPLENDFEFAYIRGVICRLLLTRKFRTRNPIYLIFMAFVGVLYSLVGILSFTQSDWSGIFTGILFSPYLIVGILLLINVFLSLWHLITNEYEDDGKTFF